jgi:hypothetical protein
VWRSGRISQCPLEEFADDAAQRDSEVRLAQLALGRERFVRGRYWQLGLEDGGPDRLQHLAQVGLRPAGAEQAGAGADDGDGFAA